MFKKQQEDTFIKYKLETEVVLIVLSVITCKTPGRVPHRRYYVTHARECYTWYYQYYYCITSIRQRGFSEGFRILQSLKSIHLRMYALISNVGRTLALVGIK